MTAAGEKHVVLVGLPGAGKTSVGRRLAKEMHRPFADADEQLELTAGSTIPRYFADHGEAAFRQLETEVMAELLGRSFPLVVAAGGGAIIRDETRALLTEHAVVVWLRGSVDFLVGRTDPTHRPLLAEDPTNAYARLAAERSDLYASVADEIVDIEQFHTLDDKPKRVLARHIAELLEHR